ncbi:hypothetical protein RvY_08236 [Ramazzottius varieornatus]|uniref:SRP54-type proteins GTP-binding domain-containing protein n=1 Tax=Ramazzottius varieornatus TaxID=947166 RepID=A0A1D1V7H3_RAMVA|nr:hypothetical protein RvY_08236 [Ramazzottius varieornatus]
MLDFFTIFSKGGIVLFYFQSTNGMFLSTVNELIRSVLLEEKGGKQMFQDKNLQLQYKLDNEFDLVFVVGYQKFLQLNYVDKFLTEIQLRFRDEFKNELQAGNYGEYKRFEECYKEVLRQVEEQTRAEGPKAMKTFQESQKSQKTVASLVEKKGGADRKDKGKASKADTKSNDAKTIEASELTPEDSPKAVGAKSDDEIQKNREKLFGKRANGPTSPKAKPKNEKKTKQSRQWEQGGTYKDARSLDFSKKDGAGPMVPVNGATDGEMDLVGRLRGELPDMDEGDENEYGEDDDSEVEEEDKTSQKPANGTAATSKRGFGGMFNIFKGLVGTRTITKDQLGLIVDKMRVLLIEKNVAAEIADKLCVSVAEKLEGKALGTFEGVNSVVRNALEDALTKILTPKKPVNVLRDALASKKNRQPFVVTFCGVNGVGKSTNLAKIAFWFLENDLRVLIAACDTFRAGAVEQLRTHRTRLNNMYPGENPDIPKVFLYEKGYGKDAAGIAMEAIQYARDNKFDVVLVDTAGRMQDNEPLMRALAKLIKVNQPDMVLFVGEALVGNEAVDQVVKFNQALADFSQAENPRIIDGIVLTKFDTIDDKVGAAVSMAYTTGQPIVFVGTGQTYTDLKNLNTKAVVNALMK